jgi:1,4-alpha-glucan branching enzyme
VEQFSKHRGIQKLMGELNRLYVSESALHAEDGSWQGFEWVDMHDAEASVLIFKRIDPATNEEVIVVCHFTPLVRDNYPVGVKNAGIYTELLNTDDPKFGGSGVINGTITTGESGWQGHPHSLRITLPPLGVVYLKLSEAFAQEEKEEGEE